MRFAVCSLVALVLLQAPQPGAAGEEDLESRILAARRTIVERDGRLEGPGLEMLQGAAREHGAFLVGEIHLVEEVPQLLRELLPVLHGAVSETLPREARCVGEDAQRVRSEVRAELRRERCVERQQRVSRGHRRRQAREPRGVQPREGLATVPAATYRSSGRVAQLAEQGTLNP